CRAVGPLLEADPLIQGVSRHLGQLLDAQRVVALFHHDDHQELVSLAAQDQTPIVLDDMHSAVGQVWRTGQAMLISDTFADARFMAEVASQSGYLPRSMMIAPLADRPQGGCPGVLMVMHRKVDHFTSRHLQLLQAAIVQLSMALER